jgi:hypothetical protein
MAQGRVIDQFPNSSMRSIALQDDAFGAIPVDIYALTCYIRGERSGLEAGVMAGKRRRSVRLKVGETRSWEMIMRGGQHMLSFRKVAVFIAVAGLMVGLASVADAAHTSSHKRSTGQGAEITGRQGKPEMILQGPVVSVSPATGFVVIQHGAGKNAEEIPVLIDNRTTLMIAGKKASIDEVKTGDRVRVRYSGQPGEVSKTVDVVAGPSMRSKKRT